MSEAADNTERYEYRGLWESENLKFIGRVELWKSVDIDAIERLDDHKKSGEHSVRLQYIEEVNHWEVFFIQRGNKPSVLIYEGTNCTKYARGIMRGFVELAEQLAPQLQPKKSKKKD